MTDSAPIESKTQPYLSLTPKQQKIYDHFRENVPEDTYFKSRTIADEIGLNAQEVGTNMPALVETDLRISIESWGYTSATTWMATVSDGTDD